MGLYADQVLPRITNVLLSSKEFGQVRQRVASSLSGDVLEVGFGSGLNVPYYPDTVRQVQAIDPAMIGRKLAAKRVAASAVPVRYIGVDGEQIALEDGSVDHVLITWTMCTIPDVNSALSEMHRVLRPGGALHFAEHGLSPDPNVVKWQHRMEGIQKAWAGGCHLTRPIDRLIDSAGFAITHLTNFYAKGPKSTSYMYEGIATRA